MNENTHLSSHMIDFLKKEKKYQNDAFLRKLPLDDLFTLWKNEDGDVRDLDGLYGCFDFWRFARQKTRPDFNKDFPLEHQLIAWKEMHDAHWRMKRAIASFQDPPRPIDPEEIIKFVAEQNPVDWISISPEEGLTLEVVLEETPESKVIDPEEIAEWGRTRRESSPNPFPWSRVGSEEEAKARYEKFIALSNEEKRNFMRHYNKENGLPEGNLHALRLIYPMSKKFEEKDFEFAKEKEESPFTSDSEEDIMTEKKERKAFLEKLEQTRAIEDISFVSGIEKRRRRMELRKETEKIDPYEIIKDSHPLMDPYANPGM